MNAWFKMASDATLMMWDAQQVMALRFMRIASGGPAGMRELETSSDEKVDELSAAQIAGVAGIADGTSAPVIAKKVARIYKKRVDANKRRLTNKRRAK